MSEDDYTVAGGVGFWLLSESLCNGGKILGVRKAVRASPSLGFGFISNDIVNIREDFLELSSAKLSDEGGGEVEDEDLGKSYT